MKVGDRVKTFEGSVGTISRPFVSPLFKDRTAWWVKLDNLVAEASYWEEHLKLIVPEPRNEIEVWFDELLANKPQKKERVTDEIDWEKHKQFMRDL